MGLVALLANKGCIFLVVQYESGRFPRPKRAPHPPLGQFQFPTLHALKQLKINPEQRLAPLVPSRISPTYILVLGMTQLKLRFLLDGWATER